MKLKQKLVILASILLFGSTISLAPAPVYATSSCQTAILPSSLCSSNGKNNIVSLLVIGINILTAGIGIAAVGGIIYAALLYATAQDNASQVSKSKMIITNVVIGIVSYFLMYGVLNFIIPGGLLQ